MTATDPFPSAAHELLDVPYCPWSPTVKQAAFLLDLGDEALYGGATGGGKSAALLMAALQFIDIPGYSALILRRHRTDLAMPGGLLDIARQWLTGHANWNSDITTWTFASGATLTFGYLESDRDLDRYQGAQFQYIAFDELTQFPEHHYTYLFSRLRRPTNTTGAVARVPLRMRAATNPGGRGHDWVKRRFVTPDRVDPQRRFHRALLVDNPHLDADTYLANLDRLDPIRRAQYVEGDWDVRPDGRMFKRGWFGIVDRSEVPDGVRRVRYWDLAATPETAGRDPDYTVGCLVARDNDAGYFIENVARFRGSPAEVRRRVAAIAEADGRQVTIVIEQEPGSSGKALIDDYQRDVLDGYTVYGDVPSGSKTLRAEPVASRAEAGHIRLVTGGWNGAFLDEVQLFPDGPHDDQVDALTGAFARLALRSSVRMTPEQAATLGANLRGLERSRRSRFDYDGP